ncbi:uncharacterized protein F5Z01DRAFT_674472 [Emericellopsis atlantica]|uniref:Tim44-like domain-containing protein n=1 Tax=Emericellopsis atlantica TaxID=2614577 RepID=A0A9P8CPG2_9HYPO|nr:uncharacterized protein F5Z01DRAFT_674472 [Emericellopsis atlantica]KAG9254157.1 hypothetical protein F5Z01DRAFT_674472 [Emericellopsis atlantica]
MSSTTRLVPLRRPLFPPLNQVRYNTRSPDQERRMLRLHNRKRDHLEKPTKKTDGFTLAGHNADMVRRQLELGTQPLFPKTFVSLPIHKYLGPEFFQYSWLRFKAWAQVCASNLVLKWQSADTTFGRAKWKMNKSRIPPAAQALYRDLLEAFAAGDVATIEKVATPAFGKKYIHAIQKRKPGETMSFEIEFNKGWLYPRLMSYMATNVSPTDDLLMGEQAVVAISSIQRLHKGDDVKEQRVLEYVVVRREFRRGAYLPVSQWRIWQTTKPTTLESWNEAESSFNERLLQQFGSEIGYKKPTEEKKAKA